jgi:hypothetical protein
MRAFDWGYGAPFSVGWWAVVSDDHHINGKVLPRGALVRYREWYGAERAGVGPRLAAEVGGDGDPRARGRRSSAFDREGSAAYPARANG